MEKAMGALHLTPGPPDDFYARTQSDRFVEGTKATLIRNASIWTWLDEGNEVVLGDYSSTRTSFSSIVDLHSHIGVGSSPSLSGARDSNSRAGLVLPWMRSLDGLNTLNTHDDAYQLSIAGGVTTVNVLPGSADAIGGRAFVIKLRPTAERSSSAILVGFPACRRPSAVDVS
ncbi:hypothetical protein DFH07DRAFT_979515 [Mycena maculata]|uniref:Uncharacterized protein n=1 Tax=Mycena maculata TaxID=230809 RepID=A0AAD7N370_9AGAR|nr:hypothetical protein DFH07DRAFT_979515 [Mycena maculata]